MVSVYGYTTVTAVEQFSGIDYSVVDSTVFTAANIDAKITMAERLVNAYLGVSTGQTKTDGVIMSTVLITVKLLDNNMNHLGYHTDIVHTMGDTIGLTIDEILYQYLGESSKKRDIAIKTDVTDNFFATD